MVYSGCSLWVNNTLHTSPKVLRAISLTYRPILTSFNTVNNIQVNKSI